MLIAIPTATSWHKVEARGKCKKRERERERPKEMLKGAEVKKETENRSVASSVLVLPMKCPRGHEIAPFQRSQSHEPIRGTIPLRVPRMRLSTCR